MPSSGGKRYSKPKTLSKTNFIAMENESKLGQFCVHWSRQYKWKYEPKLLEESYSCRK